MNDSFAFGSTKDRSRRCRIVAISIVLRLFSSLSAADMKLGIADWRTACLVIAIVISMASVGCGKRNSTVTGKVVYGKDGFPMTAGTVMFVSVEGQRLARGDIHSDGTFTLGSAQNEGILPGKYGVCIVPPDTSSQRENGIIGPPVMDSRFLNTQTSELQFDVQPGKNDITVKVSKPAGG